MLIRLVIFEATDMTYIDLYFIAFILYELLRLLVGNDLAMYILSLT